MKLTAESTKGPAENWRSSWFAIFGLQNRTLQVANASISVVKKCLFPLGYLLFKDMRNG